MTKLVSLLMIMATLCLVSCSSDGDDGGRYYVKYTISAATWHLDAKKTIKCNTQDGEKTLYVTDWEWEATYGPVSKSFKPRIICTLPDGESLRNGQMKGRIYVSRDKEPFVLKAEGSDAKQISLSCNIDF